MPNRLATRVLIVGGGPVGTTLAIDLAWRGIDVMVAELRHRGEPPSVKCNHVAARTMEIFRRLGVASACVSRPAARLSERRGVPHHHDRDRDGAHQDTLPARSLHREGRAGRMVADARTAAPDQPDLPGAGTGGACRRDAWRTLFEPDKGAGLYADLRLR